MSWSCDGMLYVSFSLEGRAWHKAQDAKCPSWLNCHEISVSTTQRHEPQSQRSLDASGTLTGLISARGHEASTSEHKVLHDDHTCKLNSTRLLQKQRKIVCCLQPQVQ